MILNYIINILDLRALFYMYCRSVKDERCITYLIFMSQADEGLKCVSATFQIIASPAWKHLQNELWGLRFEFFSPFPSLTIFSLLLLMFLDFKVPWIQRLLGKSIWSTCWDTPVKSHLSHSNQPSFQFTKINHHKHTENKWPSSQSSWIEFT